MATTAIRPNPVDRDDPTPILYVEHRRRITACVDIDGNSGVEVFAELRDGDGATLTLRHYDGPMDGNEVYFADAGKIDHLITALSLVRARLAEEQG